MTRVVLDASAVLAVIHEEPGVDVVTALLADAIMSTVNYGEVISKLVERGVAGDLAVSAVEKLGIQVIDLDISLARRAGLLRANTLSFGLSLADRICLALAEREGVPAITADRKWARLDLGIEVRLIR